MAQVEIGTVSYTLSADYFARIGADFDTEAVDNDILAELNRLVPMGVRIQRDGRVFADEDIAAEAATIDWDGLLARIDVDQILANHAR
jgi:hypothetical protein